MRNKWLRTGVAVMVVPLLLAAFYGILGNSAYAGFLLLLDQLTKPTMMDLWLWIISLVLLLVFLCTLSYSLWQRKVSKHALSTLQNIVDLDSSLLRLLASWVPGRNHDNEIKLILSDLLCDATKEFEGHVNRASIFLPDGDYLKIWAHYGMPPQSINRTQFYIGTDRNKLLREQGIAGEAFLSGQLCVGYMYQENNIWRCNFKGHVEFDLHRPYPPYRSFVCVPIVGETQGINTGIVCFDSMNQTIFEAHENQVVLRAFARRIASALLICRKLQ